MPKKKNTEIVIDSDIETPLVVHALEYQVTFEKNCAYYSKNTKKKVFHDMIAQRYQIILDTIKSAK